MREIGGEKEESIPVEEIPEGTGEIPEGEEAQKDRVLVSCGQYLTENTVMSNDLLDCPGDGLVINADNVTLDCDGHLIDGDGSGSSDRGIRVAAKDNVIVKNCNISDFYEGLAAPTSNNFSLLNSNLFNNRYYALTTSTSLNAVVVNNSFFDNTEGGVYLYKSNHSFVVNNSFFNNRNGVYLSYSSGSVVVNNSVFNNTFNGFTLYNSVNNDVIDNVISNNDQGVVITSSSVNNNFSDNSVCSNSDYDFNCGNLANIFGNNACGTQVSCSGLVCAACGVPVCGDGFITPPETCEVDADCSDGYWCNTSCQCQAEAGLQCGDTITEDTVLTYDLLDCPDHGLVINASNVVLDCAGYSIVGDGVGTSDYGVYVYNKNNVFVKNCDISDFYHGMRALSSNNFSLINNDVFNNTVHGVSLYNSGDSFVVNNSVCDNELRDFICWDSVNVFDSNRCRRKLYCPGLSCTPCPS